jgi:hypothetical protein
MPPTETLYSTRIEEILWGALLVAVTLALHGVGMVLTLRACEGIKERFARGQSFSAGLGVIIVASWMIIVVHLIEVMVWAHFFLWKNAVNTQGAGNAGLSLCLYFALMDYTTLGSNYNLKLDWRLLEGMIAIAGLMTFAWSTGVLLTLAQDFQDQQVQRLKQRRAKGLAKTAAEGSPSAPQSQGAPPGPRSGSRSGSP